MFKGASGRKEEISALLFLKVIWPIEKELWKKWD